MPSRRRHALSNRNPLQPSCPQLPGERRAGVLFHRVVDDLGEILVGPSRGGRIPMSENVVTAYRGWPDSSMAGLSFLAREIAGSTRRFTTRRTARDGGGILLSRCPALGLTQSPGCCCSRLMVAASLLVVELILGGVDEFLHDFSTFRRPRSQHHEHVCQGRFRSESWSNAPGNSEPRPVTVSPV